MRLFLLIMLLTIAGCATPQQIAEEKAAAEAAQTAELKRKIENVWGPRCEAIGMEKLSDKWKDCVMQLANMDFQRESMEAQEKRYKKERWSQAVKDFGDAVYGPEATKARQIQQQPIYQSPRQTFTQCNSNGVDGFNCTTR